MKRRADNGRGFTLIEILLVILIIGMLAGVFIVAIGGTREKAKIDTTRLRVEQVIPGALDRFNLDVGRYPTTEEGIEALVKKPTFESETEGEKWAGAYLKKVPKDEWDQALHYEVVEDAGAEGLTVPYKVWSDGPNKQSGDDDDIRSWSEEEEAG